MPFVTGCSALLDEVNDPQSASHSTTTAEPSPGTTAGTNTRTTHLTALPLGEYDFQWTATVRSQTTAEHPPRIRLRLTNAGDHAVALGFGPTPPFSPMAASVSDRRRLALHRPGIGYQAPDTRTDGCWRLEREHAIVSDILKLVRLAPGETVGGTYDLYNLPGNDACFSDGEYEFTDTVFLSEETDSKLSLAVTVAVRDGRVGGVTTRGPVLPDRA